MKKRFQFASPIYWPAWLGIGILWLITRLPHRWQIAIGNSIGKLLFCFPTQLKHVTLINIKLCFPELSAQEQMNLARKNFAAIGTGIIEAAMSWWLPDEKFQYLFHINGLEHLEKALTKGKGIILLGPHFTCLEMIGRLLGMKYSFAVMYRPHKKRLIAFLHERFRKHSYLEYIPRHKLRQLLRVLNKNIPIWYAYDVDGGKKRSVFAPFFGIPTASLTAVSRLVNLSGAAVVPIDFHRCDNEFRYQVNLYPELENFPSDDLHADATRLNAALEHSIRQKPEQYVWQYKRFKTRPEGEARFY